MGEKKGKQTTSNESTQRLQIRQREVYTKDFKVKYNDCEWVGRKSDGKKRNERGKRIRQGEQGSMRSRAESGCMAALAICKLNLKRALE